MKISKYIFGFLSGCTLLSSSWALTDLLTVYQAAYNYDPTFKAARAEWLADRENLAISRAALLPQITANTAVNLVRTENQPMPATGANTLNYGLSFSQSVFDYASWAKVWQAKAVVKKAYMTYLAAEANLLQRVVSCYFEVLLANKSLYYATANRTANQQLYIQAKHKHQVGLTAITDLEEARCKYEMATAQEIESKTVLANKLEQLSEITGVNYESLAPLKGDFPRLSPEPAVVDAWVRAAETQNFELLAANFSVQAQRENLRAKHAGHLPTVGLGAGYSYNYQKQDDFASSRSRQANVGVQVNIPLFQGGAVAASARQADYQYQQALALRDRLHHQIVSNTRQAYAGILAAISKIKADVAAVRAAESSLKSIKANYDVGRKTMTDLLDAQAQLYSAQLNHARDESEYVLQLLRLRLLVGVLSVNDIADINGWLMIKQQPAKAVSASVKMSAVPRAANTKFEITKLARVAKTK